MAVFRPILAIFLPTEVQMVILRCWTGLYLNWFKSYDTNAKTRKNAKNAKKTLHKRGGFLLQNRKKTESEILTFCVITFEPIKFYTCSAPQNDCLNFNFVKGIHVVGEKIARNAQCFKVGYFMKMVGKRSFSSRKFWASGSTYYLFILFIGEFILSDNNIKALYCYKYFISRERCLQIIKWNVKNDTNS